MRKLIIPLICCAIAVIRLLYPPTKADAQNKKGLGTEKGVVLQINISDKEQKKAVLLSDTAQKNINNVFADIAKKEEISKAYIASLEKNNVLQGEQIKWFKNYVAKLKRDNSSLLLLKQKRLEGDTLEAKIIEEDRAEFVQMLTDSIRESIKPDTVLEIHRPFRKTIYKRKD